MDQMISYCGLNCGTCTIRLASLETDPVIKNSQRKTIADEISRIYGMQMTPDEITDCDGCRSASGILFSGCIDCRIRQCAIERNTQSCAFCADYPCWTLQEHFRLDPDSQCRLDELRKNKTD